MGLCTGIALAIVAHMRHGYGTIILLLVHMTIEWSEYARHGAYSNKEIVFYGLHTMLDIVFLWQEARTHLFRFRYILMGSTILYLKLLFVCMRHISHSIPAYTTNLIEIVVIGGIAGCTLSHLIRRKKKALP
jgi:hypothetical protein